MCVDICCDPIAFSLLLRRHFTRVKMLNRYSCTFSAPPGLYKKMGHRKVKAAWPLQCLLYHGFMRNQQLRTPSFHPLLLIWRTAVFVVLLLVFKHLIQVIAVRMSPLKMPPCRQMNTLPLTMGGAFIFNGSWKIPQYLIRLRVSPQILAEWNRHQWRRTAMT